MISNILFLFISYHPLLYPYLIYSSAEYCDNETKKIKDKKSLKAGWLDVTLAENKSSSNSIKTLNTLRWSIWHMHGTANDMKKVEKKVNMTYAN